MGIDPEIMKRWGLCPGFTLLTRYLSTKSKNDLIGISETSTAKKPSGLKRCGKIVAMALIGLLILFFSSYAWVPFLIENRVAVFLKAAADIEFSVQKRNLDYFPAPHIHFGDVKLKLSPSHEIESQSVDIHLKFSIPSGLNRLIEGVEAEEISVSIFPWPAMIFKGLQVYRGEKDGIVGALMGRIGREEVSVTFNTNAHDKEKAWDQGVLHCDLDMSGLKVHATTDIRPSDQGERNLVLTMEAGSLLRILRIAGQRNRTIFRNDLIALGPVTGSAKVFMGKELFSLANAQIHIGDREDAWLSIDGSVMDLRSFQGIELKMQGRGKNLRLLYPKEVTSSLPEFAYSFDLTLSQMKTDPHHAAGIGVSGMRSDTITLEDRLRYTSGTVDVGLFSKNSEKNPISSVETRITIEKGTFNTEKMDIEFRDGGTLSHRAHLSIPKNGSKAEGVLLGQKIPLESLTDGFATGSADLHVHYKGVGDSILHVIEGLNGHGTFTVLNGLLDYASINHMIASTPLPETFRPSLSRDDVVPRCFQGDLGIEGGWIRMDNLIFDSKGVLINGSGRCSILSADYSATFDTALGEAWQSARCRVRVEGNAFRNEQETVVEGFASHLAKLFLRKMGRKGFGRLSKAYGDMLGPPDPREGMVVCP
jgi:hypothetical protein